jgi:predicted branched-subunit amino acid permease
MEAAVNVASTLIDKGAILLSPACASFDMFDDFEQRGKVINILLFCDPFYAVLQAFKGFDGCHH